MLIKNAVIFTALQPEPIQADISMANGTIRAIAPGLSPAPGQEVVDAAGMRIYPGFVDAHSHLALDGYGMGYDSIDYNEMGNIISPQLRGIDRPLGTGARLRRDGGGPPPSEHGGIPRLFSVRPPGKHPRPALL